METFQSTLLKCIYNGVLFLIQSLRNIFKGFKYLFATAKKKTFHQKESTNLLMYESRTSHNQTFKYCTYKGAFLIARIILRYIFWGSLIFIHFDITGFTTALFFSFSFFKVLGTVSKLCFILFLKLRSLIMPLSFIFQRFQKHNLHGNSDLRFI